MVAPLPSQSVVVFGVSGDITRRKLLPAFYNLFLDGRMPRGFAIAGYGRTELTDEGFRDLARESLREFARRDADGEAWRDFAGHLHYLSGGYSAPGRHGRARAVPEGRR